MPSKKPNKNGKRSGKDDPGEAGQSCCPEKAARPQPKAAAHDRSSKVTSEIY